MPSPVHYLVQPAPIAMGAIVSPAAWFRYGVGITVATGVSQWNDQSGNARHLTQGTAGSQPALQADSSILFDGVDDQLSNNAFTLAQPFTIYLLANIVAYTGSTQIFNSASVGNTLLNMQNSGAVVTLRMNATSNFDLTSAAVAGTYFVSASVFNGASSVSQTSSGNAVTGDAGTNTLNGFSLASSFTPSLWSNIQVKEVIIFPVAHGVDTRARILRYLSQVGRLSF